MIAVTFALPAESSAFRRRLRNRRRVGAVTYAELVTNKSETRNQISEIVVIHTGVGASECQKQLGTFLKNHRPSILISSGFCGGASDQVSPGQLFVAENYSDAELAQRARAAMPGMIAGKLFSADEVIDPATDRYAIGRKHGAMAIDMETEMIARICAAKNIPMLGLRVVSDSPAAPFPAPPNVLFDVEAQRTKFSRLLTHLAREPAAVVRLAKFSKQVAAAREKLAEALCAVIPVL
jgi:adenosylhomocysteine nucleosidase